MPINTTAWTGTARGEIATTPNFSGPKQFQQLSDEAW